jgi:hypothetical protein
MANSSMKHAIGIIALVVAAIVLRFLPLPSYDIYIHDTYFVVRLSVIAFWWLLIIAALRFLVAILQHRHHS